MKLNPLEDRVVIEPLESEDKTPGGIILPDQAKEKPRRGRVLAVGPGKVVPGSTGGLLRLPMTLEVGNLVCYSAYAGSEISQPDGNKVIVMNQSDVLATVE